GRRMNRHGCPAWKVEQDRSALLSSIVRPALREMVLPWKSLTTEEPDRLTAQPKMIILIIRLPQRDGSRERGRIVMTMPTETPHSPEELRKLRHDLRTPFNAIIGFTEMLMEVAEDEGQGAFLLSLHQVNSDARDLLGVVNTALAADTEVRSGDLWN